MADLYHVAAGIIKAGFEKKGNLKSMCLSSRYKNKKKLYALVCQTVKYKKLIDKVLKKSHDLLQGRKIESYLQLVLVYDILFGKGIHCGGDLKAFFYQNEAVLKEGLKKIQKKDSTGNNIPDVHQFVVTLPRYVRVNRLKTTAEDVVDTFEHEGFTFIEKPVSEIPPNSFCYDVHIPDLLVFSPGTDLHKHPLYLEGHIILQDKASCLPAYLLHPDPGSVVIDGCAAPGNKTSHLASLMENKGKVYAFDLDKKRLQLMDMLLTKAGAECVETKRQDFLKVNPRSEKYGEAEYILLDPSCSGSGMVSRMANLLEEADENETDKRKRLKNLSSFQIAALSHALRFPKVKRVTYSTCSVYEEENENVVRRIVEKFNGIFELIDAMPSWKHRGLSTFTEGPKCLRASPEEDQTNGFFVAVFERISSNDEHLMESMSDENTEIKERSNIENRQNSTKGLASSESKRRKDSKKKMKIIAPVDRIAKSTIITLTKKQKKRRSRKNIRKPVTAS